MCSVDYKSTYVEGSTIYEEIGLDYLKSSGFKKLGVELLFKSVCLHLAYNDVITGESYLNKYCNVDVAFYNSFEYQVLSEIIDAVKDNDLEKFKKSSLLVSSKKVLPDNWKNPVFSKIQVKIPGGQIFNMLINNQNEVANKKNEAEIDWK